MKQTFKNLGLLLLILLLAFFLGEPVARFYNSYYPSDVIGLPAFLAGMTFTIYFLLGFLFGYYEKWYKQASFIIFFIPFVWLMVDMLARGVKNSYLPFALIFSGYLLGFISRKIFDRLRNTN